MNCPVCTAGLRRISYEGVEIHTCDGCGGEFVGPAQIAHIVNVREKCFAAEPGAAPRPSFGMPDNAPARQLSCPGCAANMVRINYAADTGVIVDRCSSCGGLWLDASELERIQEVLDRWQDAAPRRLRALARDLERAQRAYDTPASGAFAPSRFAFVNAIINRLLDAA
jgi:Zn-finger nucleic acid-binding protein